MKTTLPVVLCVVTAYCLVVTDFVISADLARSGAYLRVRDPLKFKLRDDESTDYLAARGSKFKIVYIAGDTCYVEFRKVVDKERNGSVRKERIYYIKKQEITPATSEFTRSFYIAGLTVPFKYRFEDGETPSALSTTFDISGALGYSFGLPRVNAIVTPMAFAGLATISLGDANSDEVETRLGITYGLGIALPFKKTSSLECYSGGIV